MRKTGPTLAKGARMGHPPIDEAQCCCCQSSHDRIRPTHNSIHKVSYQTIGRSNRDDEKMVLKELVPMLACLNSSGAGLSAL